MKKDNKEAAEISKYVSEFLGGYAELYLTGSAHTLKSYRLALALYLEYLEDKKDMEMPWMSFRAWAVLRSDSPRLTL